MARVSAKRIGAAGVEASQAACGSVARTCMKISTLLLSGASAVLLLLAQPTRTMAQESSTTMAITADFNPKIAGDATTAGHVGEISVVSFKFGIEQKGSGATGGGLTAGKPEFQPMTIYKYLDKASARLFVECAKGTHFKTMTLSVSESNIETPQIVQSLLTIQLANVQIKS